MEHDILEIQDWGKFPSPIFQIPANNLGFEKSQILEQLSHFKLLDPNLTPLPTYPGMKYFRKGNPRCWRITGRPAGKQVNM